MSRTSGLDVPVQIELNTERGAPTLSEQIAHQLRSSIATGVLRADDRLPAIRSLATRLSVARATVDTAYAQLIAEGYLDARRGSGTWVAQHLPERSVLIASGRSTARGQISTDTPDAESTPASPDAALFTRPLSARAQWLAEVSSVLLPQKQAPLAIIAPSEEMSPGKAWTQIANRLGRTPWRHAGYGEPKGYLPLRQAVAQYARKFRGVVCDADRVIITSGSQQAMTLCTQVLLQEGDLAWVEDPCYALMAATIKNCGVRTVPVPVDAHGLDVAAGVALAPDAKAAFVTPSHQFPLGMMMTMPRRTELLAWAQRTQGWIIEDDYDSELRYEGRPFPSLQGMDDTSESVIYLGTFSKMLFPGLRLGYAIVPRQLVDAFAGARLLADRYSSEAVQATLAEYIERGHYDIHVRRVRGLMHKRRQVLIDECDRLLHAFGSVVPCDQGMHVVFALNDNIDDVTVANRIRARGVELRAISPFYVRQPASRGFMLGFGGFTPQAIKAAVGVVYEELGRSV